MRFLVYAEIVIGVTIIASSAVSVMFAAQTMGISFHP
jgi:hypothetical protein